MIFEIYTPENPMSTVESYYLAYFCNLFTLCIYCKVETASTKYQFNRIMGRPNNLVNRIMVKPNNLVNRIFGQPNNLVNRIIWSTEYLVDQIIWSTE